MPLLSIKTNQALDNPQQICLDLSNKVAGMLGKPESYVMVAVQPAQHMTFAGSAEPTALVELKSLGLPESQTTEFSQTLCSVISELMNVPAARIYIEFSSPQRHMWGWDNRTFG